MSRVMTFSRTFPAYHPRRGEETRFVEQILNSLKEQNVHLDFAEIDAKLGWSLLNNFGTLSGKKHHTIRAGNRWKVGDKFSPRVWSGKPYASKQIIIAPDIEVKKVWDIEVINSDGTGIYDIGFWIKINDVVISDCWVNKLAINDGLNIDDFHSWFKYPQPFTGQIICWNENINY